jgi:hypothetical protein
MTPVDDDLHKALGVDGSFRVTSEEEVVEEFEEAGVDIVACTHTCLAFGQKVRSLEDLTAPSFQRLRGKIRIKNPYVLRHFSTEKPYIIPPPSPPSTSSLLQEATKITSCSIPVPPECPTSSPPPMVA